MQAVQTFTEFETRLVENNWTLIYFTASWCKPCASFSPVMKEVATAYEKLLPTLKVDVEALPEANGMYRIQAIPALVLVNNGVEVSRAIGAQSQSQVMQWLSQHLLSY